MLNLSEMTLDEIEAVDTIHKTAPGQILIFNQEKEQIVGLRTTVKTPTGVEQAVIVLQGEKRGQVFTLEELRYPSALIVTDLVEIIATDLNTFVPSNKEVQPGLLLYHPERKTVAMSGRYEASSTQHLAHYVYVKSNDAGFPVGQGAPSLNISSWIGVARSFDIRRRKAD